MGERFAVLLLLMETSVTSESHSSALAERDGERIRERGKEKESLSVDIQNSFFFPLFFLIFKF